MHAQADATYSLWLILKGDKVAYHKPAWMLLQYVSCVFMITDREPAFGYYKPSVSQPTFIDDESYTRSNIVSNLALSGVAALCNRFTSMVNLTIFAHSIIWRLA